MTDSLLAISIGPVQPFIAAARKTRDFWCGSALLSQIARAIARSLQEQGATLIFPAPKLLEERVVDGGKHQGGAEVGDADIANKVLARMSGDPVALAEKAEHAGRAELREIARYAFRHVPELNEELAYRQLESLLELYWASVPTTNDTYSPDRKLVERLLAARKNTREFAQVTFHARCGQKSKCAIDGQRESVGEVPTGERGRKEPLCGVCVVKRFAFASEPWSEDTTTHFAAKHAIRALKDGPAFDAFRSSFDKIGRATSTEVEASYLFDERLPSFFTEDDLKEARSALRALKQATGLQLTPYYALLRADGDRMGKAINACRDIKSHQRLSESLVVFTKKAKDIVQCHLGRVVFAGGDDVLALLPVESSVQCAQLLAAAFESTVAKQLATPTNSERPTLSVGLVIAHHLDPLTDVIELSHKAEHAAKKYRNALAVLVSKRSGGEYLASGTWGTFDRTLTRLTEAFQHNRLPKGLPHELARIAVHTKGMIDDRKLIEIAELRRVLERKRVGHGDAHVDDHTIKSLVDLIASEPERETLSSLVTLLGVARELASISHGGDR